MNCVILKENELREKAQEENPIEGKETVNGSTKNQGLCYEGKDTSS